MKTYLPPATGLLAILLLLLASAGCREADRLAAAEPPAAGTTNAPATNAVAGADTTPIRTLGPVLRPLPPGVAEVVELVQSGAAEDVQRAYVEAATTPFELSVEDILYLRDIGVSSPVVAAMLKRGNDLREQAAAAAEAQASLQNAVDQLRDALTPAADATAAAAEAPAEAETAAQPAPAEAAVPAVPAGFEMSADAQSFYADLAPYGSWHFVPVHGWVWQPQVVVVNRGWRPYCDAGRWIWTDCGWYWASDYSWGWAPFHYGRWFRCSRLGWAWVPDRCWGPSWVTWRTSGAFCGWAPLPPGCGWSSGVGITWHGSRVSVGFGFGLTPSCFSFVSWNNFCRPRLRDHCVSGPRSTVVYNDSTVINNIIVGDHNTIINEGLGLQRVTQLARAEVPRASVRELPATAGRVLRADRLERTPDGPVVYRPAAVNVAEARAPQSVVRPAATPGLRPGPALTAARAPTPATGFGPLASAARPTANLAATGGGAAPAPATVSAAARRPGLTPASPYASRQPAAGTPAGGTTARRPEARAVNPVTQAQPLGGDRRLQQPGQRQTLPVPLADPGRVIRSEARARPAITAPAPVPSPGTAPRPAVQTATPAAAPRPAVTAPRPAVTPQARIQTPVPAAPAPRVEARHYGTPVTRPAPQAAPSLRPQVATPAPAVRPHFNPPAAARPTPVVAPAPSRPVVNPVPPQSGGRSGAGRGHQPN